MIKNNTNTGIKLHPSEQVAEVIEIDDVIQILPYPPKDLPVRHKTSTRKETDSRVLTVQGVNQAQYCNRAESTSGKDSLSRIPMGYGIVDLAIKPLDYGTAGLINPPNSDPPDPVDLLPTKSFNSHPPPWTTCDEDTIRWEYLTPNSENHRAPLFPSPTGDNDDCDGELGLE